MAKNGNDKKVEKAGPVWGPENPHPLSRMKTELVWEGKAEVAGVEEAHPQPDAEVGPEMEG